MRSSASEELGSANDQLREKVAELKSTNDDLANLLSSTDIPILFLDTGLRIKRFTPATRRLFNLVATDVGRPFSDIGRNFDDDTLLDDIRRVLETLNPIEREAIAGDGCYYLRRALPYRTGDGGVGGVVITFVDISARKRAEEQLQRLAAVARDSNDAITVQDLDGRIIVWNQGAQRMYGWSESEALCMHIRELIPESRRAEAEAMYDDLAAGKIVESFETQRLTRDGRLLDVWLTVTVLADETGAPSAVATTERDVSARKRAEDALREQTNFSRSLVETAQAIVLLMDPDGRVIQINPYFEQLTGYAAEEVEGADWFTMFVPDADRTEISALFDDVMRTGINPGHINPIVGKDGAIHQIEWRAKTLVDGAGRIVGLLSVGHDVTEQIGIEKAMQDAKAQAERANAAKSRFLASASHDLRQPLQTISLLNEVLEKRLDDPELKKILDNQREALDVIDGLLKAYLDITKLEAGIVRPAYSDFCVGELLERLRAEFQPHCERKGLVLRVVPSSVAIHSDPALLTQIMHNLVSNAIRHTPPPGRVLIGCRRRGLHLRLEVWDTGPGIPGDQLERIFEEFYQLDNPARGGRAGIGLGLTIVDRTAQLLGHTVDVRSTPGKGSAFSVVVPSARRPKDSAPVDAPGAPGGAATTGASVLIVDDDPAIIAALDLFLSSWGLRVTTAADGAQALARLESGAEPPDLIICDFRLPGGQTGLEVIDTLRSAAGRTLPAILMTGDTAPERLREAEATDCRLLLKPAREQDLMPVIRELLDRR